MAANSWIWKAAVAGAVGSVAHFVLMYFKSRTGLLPAFQPYKSLQTALGNWIGTSVPAIVPWALSFLNGMTILGFLFARISWLLPGKSGAAKGAAFGLIGWLFMGLIFFPAIGLGTFAINPDTGLAPALLSLLMIQTYSIVLGTTYGLLEWANE